MSIMAEHSLQQDGIVNRLALASIGISVVAFVAILLAVKYYSDAQNYKNQDKVMIATAVAQEKVVEANILDQQYTKQEQNPFNTYVGPALYGLPTISYPKTWSGYVDSTGGSGNPLDGYFDPGVVPAAEAQSSIFALRIEINSGSYSSVLQQYTSSQQSNNITITPYSLKKVPNVIGSMVQGQISSNIQGILVLFPLRTNTLEIWTEAPQYENIFLNQILPSVTFQP